MKLFRSEESFSGLRLQIKNEKKQNKMSER